MSQKNGFTTVSAIIEKSPEISVDADTEPSQSHKKAKEVFVNDPVKNEPKVGIIGIVLILLLILGGYFKKNLVALIKKSK